MARISNNRNNNTRNNEATNVSSSDVAENNQQSVKELWEKHPVSFYIASMATLAIFLSGVFVFYFTNRIEDIRFSYDQQINNLKENHQRDIEMTKLKATQDAQEATYISIESNSKSGAELKELLKNYSRKK